MEQFVVRFSVLVILGLAVGFLVGVFFTACVNRPPRTHDEWAAYCLEQEKIEDFAACLDQWNEWKSDETSSS